MEYSPAAWERAMRMQDVILRAISGELSWFAAADILQMTPRNLRRWRERYERWAITDWSTSGAVRQNIACRWRSSSGCYDSIASGTVDLMAGTSMRSCAATMASPCPTAT
jgi:hypothetical protein